MSSQPSTKPSIKSHRANRSSDFSLNIHSKDPLTFSSAQGLGIDSHQHGAPLLVDYNMMAQQRQPNCHGNQKYQQLPSLRAFSELSSHIQQDHVHELNSSIYDRGHTLCYSDTCKPIMNRHKSGENKRYTSESTTHPNNVQDDIAVDSLINHHCQRADSLLVHHERALGSRKTPIMQLTSGAAYPSPPSLPSPEAIVSAQLPTPSIAPAEPLEHVQESSRPPIYHGTNNHQLEGHYDQNFCSNPWTQSPIEQDQQIQRLPSISSPEGSGDRKVGASRLCPSMLHLGIHSPLSSNQPSPVEPFQPIHVSAFQQHHHHNQHQYEPPLSPNLPYNQETSPLIYRSRHQYDPFAEADENFTRPSSLYTPTAQSCGLKSTPVSLWKKTVWVIFTASIFLLPYCVLKACFHLQVSAGAWQTSVTYGMLMAADFVAVILFSALNRQKTNHRVKNRDSHWIGVSTGILAVGYREDPILLEGCLKSLRAMRYQRNQRILLVVDGNEPQDEYMAQVFMKVFRKQGAAVFRPQFLCMDRASDDKERGDLIRQIAYNSGPVCVMQPHRSKRSAMYTGFAALLQQGVDAVVVTDSDTFLDPAVCKELAFALAESPIIGAATGDVRIYNTGTWVSFLSSVRYWFAFNLERGAQSYHSVVNCVSGPLGIYRMSIIADVMDKWVHQSFLGVLCTYGDDRHLTNLVLREGYKVKFSHHAICYTDTPIRFIAWVTQQTRWSKSFFREIPIQLGCIQLHSPWMTYALLYQLIYPMMMVYSLVNCIYFGTGSQISWWMVSIMFVGVMKTLYAVSVTGDKKFFFTTAYGFLYILGYVPAKIFAALTLYDNSWGTSARLIRHFTQFQSYIAPVTWGAILFLGIIHNPSRFLQPAPTLENQVAPYILTDRLVVQVLICFGLAYLGLYFWFFVRTGIIHRDYKRDFSYEELYENMTTYAFIDTEGGKRKVARFEV